VTEPSRQDAETPTMNKLIAYTVAATVCAGPAFAQAYRPGQDCGQDPETTGSLTVDPRSLHLPGERSDRVKVTPPEDSWQEEAREEAERHRRDLLACGVD
jgi:hypothetical protein